jgi:hypothetical protein
LQATNNPTSNLSSTRDWKSRWSKMYFDFGFAPFSWKLGDQRLGHRSEDGGWVAGSYTMYAIGPFRISWKRFWLAFETRDIKFIFRR